MSDEGLTPFEEGAAACPFIAFEDDRDHRADRPDYRHRCFAASQPEPRALPHQERYCLAVGFPQCPVFLDWARQEAAAVLPAGRRPAVSAPDDDAGARPGRVDGDAPAFLAGLSRQTPSDEAAPAPTKRAPESIGDLWGYQGDVKRQAADTAAAASSGSSAGAADTVAGFSPGVAGASAAGSASSSAGSASSSPSASGASRGAPSMVPSSAMARPAGGHPAWERPIKPENFPRLRSRDERSSNSPLLLAMVGLAVLVVALFVYPFVTNLGGKTPAASQSSSASASSASPTSTTAPSPTATPEPSGSFIIYTVKEGDTLYTIEIQFGVSEAAILAVNPDITDPAYITIGQKINIPRPGASSLASPSSSAS